MAVTYCQDSDHKLKVDIEHLLKLQTISKTSSNLQGTG